MGREIPLSRGLVAIVDDEDHEWLSQWNWHARSDQWTSYAVRKRLSSEGGDGNDVIRMHRLILGLSDGDGLMVDHVDHDGLNNTRANIRVCTPSQNAQSRRQRHDATSQFKGVSRQKTGRWLAQIGPYKKRQYLGTFGSEAEAAKAYDNAALKRFGEFANLNLPKGKTT